jgi:peptidoglycan hydrolase-like protein with peptidoglycan-binding domain
MMLRQGDHGDQVKTLQRGLNKLGQMLLVDGNFGGRTSDAVGAARGELGIPGPSTEADDVLQNAVAGVADPFPAVTAAGVTFIARAEVTDARTYRTQYKTPQTPPAPSGVTIGIGYDCRFSTPAEFIADWGGELSADAVAQLETVLGKEGSPELKAQVAGVIVPLEAAMRVFARRSLPDYLSRTRSIYPRVDTLPPARQTALVSLVYNRGTDLDGDRRKEMRAISGLLAAESFDEVAAQFEAMTRLWNPATAAGLIVRRRSEATLWQSGLAALLLD